YMLFGTTTDAKPVTLPSPEDTSNSSEAELFTALDMHTECYSYFLLDRFIQRQLGAKLVKKISIRFLLQLDMCHRCRQAATLFETSYPSESWSSSAQSKEAVPSTLVDDVSHLLAQHPKLQRWDPFEC
ncbi:MAG TPA: hypothetical protein VFQ61_26530, partial [Polyangiaceae bacterium]|nr:hypothetical protein [Polyangiaceae bacterium]